MKLSRLSRELADLLVVRGDVLNNVALLENRQNFEAVIQGGWLRSGRLARPDR
jgi:imidazolonepropionase-like amidohydrolase